MIRRLRARSKPHWVTRRSSWKETPSSGNNYHVRQSTTDCHQPELLLGASRPHPRRSENATNSSWLFLVPVAVLCSVNWCRSPCRHDTFCPCSGDFSQSSAKWATLNASTQHMTTPFTIRCVCCMEAMILVYPDGIKPQVAICAALKALLSSSKSRSLSRRNLLLQRLIHGYRVADQLPQHISCKKVEQL